MLFGASTMTFFGRPLPRALQAIAHSGFDYAEIWADHAWDEQKGADADSILRTLQSLGLQATVHCPILDINITSNNRGIRAESIRQNLLAIDFAKRIDARLIVIHPGHRFSARESKEQHWRLQVESIREILAYAQSQKVAAAVENMDSDKDVVSIKDHQNLKRLFEQGQIKEGQITLDVTHLRTTEKVLEFIRVVGNQIAHLHLSDATTDQMHLRLGEGSLNLKEIVQALQKQNYRGVCSLECFIPNNEQLLNEELNKARALWA